MQNKIRTLSAKIYHLLYFTSDTSGITNLLLIIKIYVLYLYI